MIAGDVAQLTVDPEADSFCFELRNVVYTRVPSERETEASDEDAFVHSMEHYILGPVPYGVDIIHDGVGGGSPKAPAPDLLPIVQAEQSDEQ